MNPALEKLIKRIEQSPPGLPDFKQIANLLDNINPETKDWKTLFPLLKKHYDFDSSNDLVQALMIGGNEVYVDDFLPILKEHKIKGWIGEYVQHTMGMEPPTAYHFGIALVLLGACLQRQIYVPRGYFRIWPAIHVLLVGPSADGKTTAGDYGYKLLQHTGRTVPVIGESKQYIHSKLYEVQEQTGNAVGMIYSPELAEFIGEDDWKKSLVAYLIRLMDGEDDIPAGSLNRKDQNLKNVGVSLLGCSNIELLDQAVPKVATGSGFMSRFFIFNCDGTDRVHVKPTIPEDAANWDWLKERLLLTQLIKGEMHLDPEAEKWFQSWYYFTYRRTFPKEDGLVPFHKRKRNFIIKLAMLLAISDEIGGDPEIMPPIGNTRYITEKHLEQAEAVLNWVSDKIPKLYDLLGNSPFGKEQNRILRILRKNRGGVDIAELSRKLKFSHRKLQEHLHTLEKNERIARRDQVIYLLNVRREEKK